MTSNQVSSKQHINGFSLIEVSVASLLIMLGVTGYVSLQSEYVLADAKLNARILALQVAQEKLTDLASYQQLVHTEDVNSYQNIATNIGGEIPSGDRDVIVTVDLGLQTFNTQWQVSDLYYVDTNFNGIADSWVKAGEPFYPIELPRHVHMKNVQVSITWIDIKGDSKQINLFSSISPLSQGQSFHTKKRLPSTIAQPF
jgi:hypothetical protein